MTQKIGPKEMAQRELQKGKLSREHQMMLDDGCPKELLRTGSGPKRKPATKPDQGVALAPPLSVQKAIAADLADEPTEAPAPPVANNEEGQMAKKPKKTAAKRKPAAKKTPKAAAPKTASGKKGVPATDIAAFICRDGGASMAELVAEFGIEAHPMRAKIHYVRHKLGYGVETKDGRYVGTPPKAEAA